MLWHSESDSLTVFTQKQATDGDTVINVTRGGSECLNWFNVGGLGLISWNSVCVLRRQLKPKCNIRLIFVPYWMLSGLRSQRGSSNFWKLTKDPRTFSHYHCRFWAAIGVILVYPYRIAFWHAILLCLVIQPVIEPDGVTWTSISFDIPESLGLSNYWLAVALRIFQDSYTTIFFVLYVESTYSKY